ncbi:complex III assembly factor LYRM7 [Diachasma alloeum]|uniref:complex III assembly factor LYRM7 n=1 Tax=Diachasma alloeum TaxID=454923 RepID=UPI0007381C8A|nr:complex III assembly factor LYRM7 [Diachasma alloeum]XP_015124817.1 complex III assembly factor LYRM7 [Diachasma alloeum]XP_015124818.1 complex III assembly factor LYRM7 [Diachasma alloeum]XP_015124819.1 complex III assembly factor LYRM7 [Diachasma alloeum]XP_015124820.1 complex III assembly factor LYRM7 [Diachasma alloeum]
MSGELRREVLKIFKKLHRTRLSTFEGDEKSLNLTRQKINDEYRKYKHVTDQDAIVELNKFALDVDHELRTSVVQAVEKAPGRYELKIKEEHLIDNFPVPGTPLPTSGRRCGGPKVKT